MTKSFPAGRPACPGLRAGRRHLEKAASEHRILWSGSTLKAEGPSEPLRGLFTQPFTKALTATPSLLATRAGRQLNLQRREVPGSTCPQEEAGVAWGSRDLGWGGPASPFPPTQPQVSHFTWLVSVSPLIECSHRVKCMMSMSWALSRCFIPGPCGTARHTVSGQRCECWCSQRISAQRRPQLRWSVSVVQFCLLLSVLSADSHRVSSAGARTLWVLPTAAVGCQRLLSGPGSPAHHPLSVSPSGLQLDGRGLSTRRACPVLGQNICS